VRGKPSSRRFALLLLLAAGFHASLAGQAASPGHVVQVGPVVMTVADMSRSVDFYTRVLTFEKTSDTERSGPEFDRLYGIHDAHIRTVDLRLGDESIELLRFVGRPGAPVQPNSRSNDLAFQHVAIIVSDMDAAYGVLRQNHVEQVSSFPQTLPAWNPNAAGIKAFYFKDPDGHPLEILQFPPNKGDPKWHSPRGKLFLGIDHTAIVVSNTDRSLAFYQQALGMRIAGESENYGTEQEHLNNVFGAHLRITSLRSAEGIGIEFLEYIAPRDSRPASSNAAGTDIGHHETTVVVDDLDAFNTTLRQMHFLSGSLKPIALSGLVSSTSKAELVRDPDGHFLLAIQR
jgi:catechol 2,3-dioxygenase-like lactoylglutathione lyase family enzyme